MCHDIMKKCTFIMSGFEVKGVKFFSLCKFNKTFVEYKIKGVYKLNLQIKIALNSYSVLISYLYFSYNNPLIYLNNVYGM